MREPLYDTGLRQAIGQFLQEVDFCFRRSHCCSYSQVTIYVPKFIFAPSGTATLRSDCFGQRIIVEMRLEYMLTQFIITVGHVTDFSNPVHTTDRHAVDSDYHDRSHLRTENYTMALSQAHKFLLGVMPHLHGRMLNVITVSPGWVSNLIHSFESLDDPRGSFTRFLLANI